MKLLVLKRTFFIRNKESKSEKEYIWGGKIPPGGKRTSAQLSKKEAIWNISYTVHINSTSGNLRKTTLSIPFGFFDGNNDFIKREYKSPEANDIVIQKGILN